MIYSLLLIALILLPVLLIVVIAFALAESRKKKQKIVLSALPPQAEVNASVRYNRAQQQEEVLKIKSFEGSGILYVIGDYIYFKSTKGLETQFDMKTSRNDWVGENLINGVLKWFSINDKGNVYFFNIDSGAFVFNLDKNKPTTASIFQELRNRQAVVLNRK